MVRLLMLSAVLLGGYRDLYCPTCERFSADEWVIDVQGLCRGCGRAPAVVEAADRTWYWCSTSEQWGEERCAHDRTLRCCAPWTAAALMVVPGGAELGSHPFCPQCRTFRGFEPGADDRDHCVGCGKAPVTVSSADVLWYWCRTARRWDVERDGPCCEPKATRMPVAWLPPVPLPTSFLPEEEELVVSTDWLAARIDDGNLVLIHVEHGPSAVEALTRPTFDEGHIPFARPLEWSTIAMTRDGLPNEFPPVAVMAEAFRRIGVDADSRVVVYDSGVGMEAARAFVALEYLGLGGRVSILDGQWKQWVREGRELSRFHSGVEPSAWVPKIQPGVLCDRRAVMDVVWTALEPLPTAVLVDARPAEEYAGARPSKGVIRPGHLPGAMSVPWSAVVLSPDNPALRPKEELRALFEAKSARPGRRILVYCRSGVEAGLPYVAARLLGYEVSLYDGSYADWGNDPELPVEGNSTKVTR